MLLNSACVLVLHKSYILYYNTTSTAGSPHKVTVGIPRLWPEGEQGCEEARLTQHRGQLGVPRCMLGVVGSRGIYNQLRWREEVGSPPPPHCPTLRNLCFYMDIVISKLCPFEHYWQIWLYFWSMSFAMSFYFKS